MPRLLNRHAISLRRGLGACAVVAAVWLPGSAAASPSTPTPTPTAAAAAVTMSVVAESSTPFVLAPDDDAAPDRSDAEGSPLRPFLGVALIAIVFVVGLRAVKRQRDEGRRSKLPPIG